METQGLTVAELHEHLSKLLADGLNPHARVELHVVEYDSGNLQIHRAGGAEGLVLTDHVGVIGLAIQSQNLVELKEA